MIFFYQTQHVHFNESMGGGRNSGRVRTNSRLHRATGNDNPGPRPPPARLDHQRLRTDRVRVGQHEGNMQAGKRRPSNKRRSRSG